MSKSKIRLRLYKILAFIIGFVIGIILLEIFLRFYNPIETRIKGNQIVLPINKRYSFKNDNIMGIDKEIIHTKNSIGFRGPEIPLEGLENTLSIIAVGGSTTECFYLSDGMDWPALLLKHLKNDFKAAWVNNAGLDGHSTFGHVILLQDHIIKRAKSKIVLFLIGLNDMGCTEIDSHITSQIKVRVRFHSFESFIKSLAPYSEVASMIQNIYLYLRAKIVGLPHKQVNLLNIEKFEKPETNYFNILEYYMKNYIPSFKLQLKKLILISENFKIDPILITQPALYGKGIEAKTGVDLSKINIEGISGFTKWKALELYNDVIRNMGKDEGLLVIDLASELAKDSDYFYDFYHFTNRGSREVAKIIYEHLRPYLQENYSSFLDN